MAGPLFGGRVETLAFGQLLLKLPRCFFVLLAVRYQRVIRGHQLIPLPFQLYEFIFSLAKTVAERLVFLLRLLQLVFETHALPFGIRPFLLALLLSRPPVF